MVEKKFIYLVVFSLLIHAAVAFIFLNLPEKMRTDASKPVMVDLAGIQTLPPLKEPDLPVQRKSAVRQRVTKEFAPKGDSLGERTAPLSQIPAVPPFPGREESYRTAPESPFSESLPRDELFRNRRIPPASDMAALYPGAAKMARLEESYRKKYHPEVADGETSFLNTDDIEFGSFLRRFETAVYGVWRYPADAARMGIEGVTPVKITFNRMGEIVASEILQSSGSKILDQEVLRTLRQIGPVGSFPKGYEKETFRLIAFFHYGITQGAIRSLR